MSDSAKTRARVLVSYGSHGIVQTGDGGHHKTKFRRSVGRPYCGDDVMIARADEDSFVVEEILPRRNQFLRADQRGRPHTVAANLDRVLIVIASRPLPSQDLLDRYLVAVHSLFIEPIIVHNKTDLKPDCNEAGAQVLSRLPEYAELGYTVIRTCCKQEHGVDELIPVVANGINVLVGQSGVGKSSLVRRLLPDLEIQVGELSRITGKGTHTTTTTTLYSLPDGGRLIDSPGVWEYGLWQLDEVDVALGFPEFEPFLGQCRFNNCLHSSEPACAVKAACEKGSIKNWRYHSYLRLLEQNSALAGT